MSFAAVIPYFRNRLTTVGGLTEWMDPDFENVPENIIDGAYHLEIAQATLIKQNQTCLEYFVPVTLRTWVKGFREPLTGRDTAVERAQTILAECLKHSNRLTQTGIKNIISDSWVTNALSDSNDNTIQLTMEFRAFVEIDIE